MRKLSVVLVIFLVSLMIVLIGGANGGSQYPKAANFTLPNLENKMVSLSDYKGKVVMVNFWATWCTPCRQEIPDFIKLQKKFGPSGLEIIGISIDKADIEFVKAFTTRLKVNYEILYAGKKSKKVMKSYGNIRGIPTTFLINRQGQLVKRITGFVRHDFWEPEIKKLL
ncbi:MAG: TlpA family protein disulfide reductase [Deltaproteobacteria bacterium]|nr:TlpA family protein disulfide reductase [Deltaproteobacteria bacterium]MBW2052375.1 TlpA family protein disulfide reductase [Deltaproteobacteria bacterium]MBW2140859.1 TlpA family protein disulfide reductase [Deltaproteobacteria bacterium]MBW2322418.1 TlpA family protein disulfide reductase [Deltaproteobacteria bacterium]